MTRSRSRARASGASHLPAQVPDVTIIDTPFVELIGVRLTLSQNRKWLDPLQDVLGIVPRGIYLGRDRPHDHRL